MKKVAALILAAMFMGTGVSASDWRPGVGSTAGAADRLAALDEVMAPMLVDHRLAFENIVNDITVITMYGNFLSIEQAGEEVQGRVDALDKLPGDIEYAKQLAHDAIEILDGLKVDACWADYAGVLRTGWLLYGDSVEALEDGALTDANGWVGPALTLLGNYGTLVHDKAVSDCSA